MTEPDNGTDYISEAITEAFGERCPEYSEGCPCCDAWKQYDRLRDALEIADNGLKTVTEHNPKTPGLHYESLEQLLESATGIAGMVRDGIAEEVAKAQARPLPAPPGDTP